MPGPRRTMTPVHPHPDPATLVAAVEADDTEPATVRTALARLLADDPRLGAATALGVLSRPPRIRPSTALVVDPGDSVMRRWQRRVAAGRVLVSSPALAQVFDELYDELTDSPELARDVLTGARIAPNLNAHQRTQLTRLASPGDR